ncbi:ABC transporter permease [Rhabdothermincola sediminis]|uniref:ABC transporter permease n=1 Tax=Rhabdothermincola sediminis TaxID=2751370 RepID=UPI001AA03159|nr:ABC transporter permease [Rhabdothermincola sediminis]
MSVPSGLVIPEPTVVEPDGTVPNAATEPRVVGEPPPLRRGPGRLAEGIRSVVFGLLGVVLFGVAWAVVSARSGQLPGPLQTSSTLIQLLTRAFEADGPAGQGIGLQLRDSLVRVLKGFLLAAAIGVPVGFAMGVVPPIRRMLNPIVQVLRPVSPLAWFPIWLTIMVKADPAAVWVIFVSAVWPTILNTAAGAVSVPLDQLEVARVFRFSRATQLREVVIPHALPSVVTGLRLSMGVAWMVIVAAEMLSAASGIGFYVWQSYNGPGLTHVISAVLLIGATGLVLDLGFQALGRRVAHEEVRS